MTRWVRIERLSGFLAVGVLMSCMTARLTLAEDAKNLALKKPATASSQESDDHAASKGNDDDGDSRWCADSADFPQWWQVDLEKPVNLTGAEIKWEMDGKTYKFVVEGSADGKEWKTLIDKSSNTETAQVQKLTFTAPATRYVRIRVTGADDGSWASFFEFKVFGS